MNNFLLNETYLSLFALFFIMVFFILVYLNIKYKKNIKRLNNLVEENDEKIKSLRQYAYENELKKVDREHETEKEILSLNHTIKELEVKAKEGLKSQVVTKIEEAEKRRERQLKRLNLSI